MMEVVGVIARSEGQIKIEVYHNNQKKKKKKKKKNVILRR